MIKQCQNRSQNHQISLITLLCVLHVTLTQWFSAGADIAPATPTPGQMAMSRDILVSNLGGRDNGIQWVEARDAITHPTEKVQPQMSVALRQRSLLEL